MYKCTECITILSNFAGDGWTLQMVFGLDGKSFFLATLLLGRGRGASSVRPLE